MVIDLPLLIRLLSPELIFECRSRFYYGAGARGLNFIVYKELLNG